MVKKYNVAFTVDVNFEEIYHECKECFFDDFSENEVKEYVINYLDYDDKLCALNEDDKEEIIEKVLNLYREDNHLDEITIDKRIDILSEMNDYILECIGDDAITELWFRQGIPDGSDVNDFKEIAIDNDCWYEVVSAFWSCIRKEV